MSTRVYFQESDAYSQVRIDLPSSKSISNRALILNEVRRLRGAAPLQLLNLSEADDTQILLSALNNDADKIDIKNAGTCLRFLTALFAVLPNQEVTLSGNERMLERPVRGLLQPLMELGADFTFLASEGKLPFQIHGKKLKGGNIKVSASESSQFVSALMMAAPLMEDGLELEISHGAVSIPYIRMTYALMKQFGFAAHASEDMGLIKILPSAPAAVDKPFEVEPDWSSAAFFFQACAFRPGLEITLNRLHLSSLQGDSMLAGIGRLIGVIVIHSEQGVVLKQCGSEPDRLEIDFANFPDLALPVALAAAFTGKSVRLTGLKSLEHKESKRRSALAEVLMALGLSPMQSEDTLDWNQHQKSHWPSALNLDTFKDHRLIMAYAMLALCVNDVTLSSQEEVEKSFPGFWEQAEKLGIRRS